MKRNLVAGAIFILLVGCTTQEALIRPTSTGYPEGLFSGATAEAVRSRLASGCESVGLFIQEADEAVVICASAEEGREEFISRLQSGNTYAPVPIRKLGFSIHPAGDDVWVIARQWVETQLDSGRVERQELNSDNERNYVQRFLYDAGAEQ